MRIEESFKGRPLADAFIRKSNVEMLIEFITYSWLGWLGWVI